MPEPKMKCSTEGGMWVRQLVFKKGDVHRGHYHSEDHVTLLAMGKIKIVVDGTTHEFKAPHIITITKGKRHDLTALESSIAYCVAPISDMTTIEEH